MFSSLRIRDFRIFWIGMFISLIGTWLQTVAQGWLVFEMTNSAFLLGLVGFMANIPILLFALLGGVVADRVERRNIILLTQTSLMILAFILAALVQFHLINVWQIMALAFAAGVVLAFDAPARQSMILDLVGIRYLTNAIALNSAAFNGSRLIGPAIAGFLIGYIGAANCFYLNALSFLAVIFALQIMSVRSRARAEVKEHIWHDFLAGIKYIFKNKSVLMLIAMIGISGLFGMSYVTLMPIFARDIFHVGAKGLGMLMTASGVGTLIGALSIVKLKDFDEMMRQIIIAALTFSIALIIFAFTTFYPLALLFLVLVGWGSIASGAAINSALQNIIPNELRGRIMSAYTLTFLGLTPFGNLLAGALASIWGAGATVALLGLACGVFFIALALLLEKI